MPRRSVDSRSCLAPSAHRDFAKAVAKKCEELELENIEHLAMVLASRLRTNGTKLAIADIDSVRLEDVLAVAIARKCEELELSCLYQLHKVVDHLILEAEGKLAVAHVDSLQPEEVRSVLASPQSPFFAAYLLRPFGARKLGRLEEQAIALSNEAAQFFSPAAKGTQKWAS